MSTKYTQIEKDIIASLRALCVRYNVKIVNNPLTGSVLIVGDSVSIDTKELEIEIAKLGVPNAD